MARGSKLIGALGVVIEARESDERGIARPRRRDDVVHEVLTRAQAYDLTWLRRVVEESPRHGRDTNDRNRGGCVERGLRRAMARRVS